jgi:NAD+ kinase
MCTNSPNLFDFVVTLGGDGTVLFASWLFQRIVPPVLPFALGSLGFLTPFDFVDHPSVMDAAIDAGIRVSLRMRFTCTVYRAVAPEDVNPGFKRRAVKKAETGEILMRLEKGGWEALEGGPAVVGPSTDVCSKDKEVMCFTTRPVETFEVLNDLVVDRGPSPYVSLLELFGAVPIHFLTICFPNISE